MPDVLIVGASVAGATTAVHLAAMGYGVQLLDRAHFPRRKACGEGLFAPGVAELERLGLLETLLPYARELRALSFHLGSRAARADLGQDGSTVIGIERQVVDAALLGLAKESGVDVRLGVAVRGLVEGEGAYAGIETDAGRFEAKVIVAADGAQSALRRQAGLDGPRRGGRYGISAHWELPARIEPEVRVYFRDGHEVYVTPVGERRANVAVLLGRGRARGLSGRLEAAYEELVSASGALPAAAHLADDPLATGPFPATARRAWQRNLVLAGDAAGFFDGVTGEGMSLALVSARLCAVAIDRHLRGDGEAAFAAYDRRRRNLARNSQLLGRLVLALASRRTLAGWAMGNMARRPQTFARLVGINQGTMGFGALRPRDVSAFLLGV